MAMNRAAGGGHMKTLQWLHENRTEGFSASGVSEDTARGFRDIVSLLASVRPDIKSDLHSIELAAERGHFEVLEWLEQSCPEPIVSMMTHLRDFFRQKLLRECTSADELMLELRVNHRNNRDLGYELVWLEGELKWDCCGGHHKICGGVQEFM